MITNSELFDRRNIERAVIGSMVLFNGQEAAEFAAGELSGTEFSCADLRTQFTAVCERSVVGGSVAVVVDVVACFGAGRSRDARAGSAVDALRCRPHARAHAARLVPRVHVRAGACGRDRAIVGTPSRRSRHA